MVTGKRITFVWVWAALALVGCAFNVVAQDASPDPAGFMNPPLCARPGAFWAWLEGHVSLDRITYELQEMKAKGMAGADIWDVHAYINPDQMIPAGPTFLGEASLKAVAHALSSRVQPKAARQASKTPSTAFSGTDLSGDATEAGSSTASLSLSTEPKRVWASCKTRC